MLSIILYLLLFCICSFPTMFPNIWKPVKRLMLGQILVWGTMILQEWQPDLESNWVVLPWTRYYWCYLEHLWRTMVKKLECWIITQMKWNAWRTKGIFVDPLFNGVKKKTQVCEKLLVSSWSQFKIRYICTKSYSLILKSCTMNANYYMIWLGFSASKSTWLPVNDSYEIGINVEDEERDAKSSLNNYKDLVKIRRNFSDLIAYGSTNIFEKVKYFLPNIQRIVECTSNWDTLARIIFWFLREDYRIFNFCW